MRSGDLSGQAEDWGRSAAGRIAGCLLLALACALCIASMRSAMRSEVSWPDMRIDVNTATAAELEVLPGIGPSRAGAIIEWRDRRGRFRRIDDLDDVHGIGPRTIARISPWVRVSHEP